MENRAQVIAISINEFYKTNLSLVIFTSIIGIFSIVQICLFGLGVTSLNGKFAYEQSGFDLAFSWFIILFTMIGSVSGFVGAILNIRKSSNFVWFASLMSLSGIVAAIAAGAIYVSISGTIMLILTIVRYFKWKNEEIVADEVITEGSNKKIFWLCITFLIFMIITLNTINIIFGSKIYSNSWNSDTSLRWTWHLDAIGASLEMTATIMIIFKYRISYAFYFISKIFYVIIFSKAGNYISVVNYALAMITDASGFIAWGITNNN